MPHLPSKEEMIHAVRTSKCSNLANLPLEAMTQEAVYTHLVAAKCPCLKRLMEKSTAHHRKNPSSDTD